MTTCRKCGRGTTSNDGVCGNRGLVKCAELAAARNKKPAAADEAPPAASNCNRKPSKISRTPKPPPVAWQAQFRALTAALGLDPDSMLEGYCRDWVESTRSRALTPPVRLRTGRSADDEPQARALAAGVGA